MQSMPQSMPGVPGAEPWGPPGPVMPVYRPPPFVRIVAILLGIAIFVGFVAFHTAVMLPVPGTPTSPNPDVVAYQLTLRALFATFFAAMDAAVGASVAFGWAWGLGKPELTEGARRGLLLFSSLLVSFWILFTMFSFSFFQFIIP